MKDFEIKAEKTGKGTEILIDGKMPDGIVAYELHSAVDELTQLDLHFNVLCKGKVKGEADVKYKFHLPEDEEVQKDLYEQLKEKYEKG